MKPSWTLQIALAGLITATLTSCNTTERLNKAATAQGKIQASVTLPDLPSDCRSLEAHASLKEGDELRSVLVRERSALGKANARVTRCAAFYSDTKSNFEGKQ